MQFHSLAAIPAVSLCALLVAGCGGDNSFTPFDGPAPLPDPPGFIVPIPPSGATASREEARLRVIRDLLSIEGLALADVQGVVVGAGGESNDDLFELPGGPFPAGTVINTAEPEFAPVTLNDSYHVFWLDPQRTANLGHDSSIVYVRASDGRITLQDTQFPAQAVAGASLDEFEARERALVYRHEIWAIHDSHVDVPLPVETLPAGSGAAPQPSMHGGPRFGGLGFSGSTDPQFAHDLDNGESIYRSMTGSSAGWKRCADLQHKRATTEGFAEKLRTASAGLGADDKFFLLLATHCTKFGGNQIGLDVLYNRDLCEMILDNVSAGTINIITSTCYGGKFACDVADWANMTDKEVRVIASTDKDHVARANRGSGTYAVRCIRDKLKMAFEAERAGGGTLTLPEIEAIFAGMGVSRKEIEDKLCMTMETLHGTPLPEAMAKAKEDAVKPDVPAVYGEFDGDTYVIKPAVYCGGGPVTTGGFPADPVPPGGGGGGGGGGTTPVEVTVPVPTGTGSTNDGAGQFDLSGGTVTLREPSTSVEVSGTMQVINLPGHGPGSYQIAGPLQRRDPDGTLVFTVTGSWLVFPGAQQETDIAGTVTLTFNHPSLQVAFDGTHAGTQEAHFTLAGVLAQFGSSGDFDADNDVDIDDLRAFQSCFGGTCPEGDLDSDGDIDQQDLFLFQNGFSGPR